MTKKKILPLSFVAVFGSEIRDPGSGIRDPGWVKIRIRDKHPRSATLIVSISVGVPEVPYLEFCLCLLSLFSSGG
jgi:hypothetical protein